MGICPCVVVRIGRWRRRRWPRPARILLRFRGSSFSLLHSLRLLPLGSHGATRMFKCCPRLGMIGREGLESVDHSWVLAAMGFDP
jgi:hypothetical protein